MYCCDCYKLVLGVNMILFSLVGELIFLIIINWYYEPVLLEAECNLHNVTYFLGWEIRNFILSIHILLWVTCSFFKLVQL